MSDGIQERIMLLVAADLADKKDRIQDEPCDDQRKKYNAKSEQSDLSQIKNDPPNIQRDRQHRQADSEYQKEDGGSAATHALILSKFAPSA